LLGLTY